MCMKLMYDKRAKDPIYYVQVGIRNGKKVTTKNIAKIGRHSELLKEHADPLAYAKSEVERMNRERDLKGVTLYIDLKKKLAVSEDNTSKSTIKNIGYLFLDQIYKKMDIDSFIKLIFEDTKVAYDPTVIARVLAYDRIIDPGSKLHTVNNMHKYFEDPLFDHQHILRFMDVLYDHYDEYISFLYKASSKVIKRDTTICYYDCTNFYFEKEREDEDYIDPFTGEVIEGLRKYGYSKEHRPNPLVQMGLFMDRDGIPMSMCIHSGNKAEVSTVLPLEKELIKVVSKGDFIYCADAALGSYDIRKFNALGGRRFVVTQSLKKLPDPLKEAIFNDFDYKLLSNDKDIKIQTLKGFDPLSNIALYNDKAYKVIDASKELVMPFYEEKIVDGKKKRMKAKALLDQKLIITFSRKAFEYQRHIRSGQIQRAKSLLESKDPDDIKKGPNDIRRFLKRKDGNKDLYVLDEDKIKEEERYDGYYAIATNIDDKSIQAILDIPHRRYKIEECFRITKTDLLGRPGYHYLKERLITHFLICYTSLLLYRLLEVSLDRNDTHFTTKEIINTLKNMNVASLDDVVYKALYTNSKSLEAMVKIFGLPLDREYYLVSDLKKMVHKK